MKKDNILLGGLFIFLGAWILGSKLGYLGDMNLFTVVISILLGIMGIKNLFKREFSGFLFSLAFIGILNAKLLGIEAITPWPILFAATLASIGMSLIFGSRKYKHGYHNFNDSSYIQTEDMTYDEDGFFHISNTFGETIKYIQSDNFKEADLKSTFAELKVYFSDVEIDGDTAVINVDARFAGIEVFIPKEWEVIIDARTFFGGIEEKNRYSLGRDKRVYIRGDITFAGLEIIYI